MGIDTCALLRIADRAAFGRALAAEVAPPSFMANADGSVRLFTGVRWRDGEGGVAARAWLAHALACEPTCIAADPRGVFVYPDLCDPKATTYDGIVAELAGSGYFAGDGPPPVPAPPPASADGALDLGALLRRLQAGSDAGSTNADDACATSPLPGGGRGRVAVLLPAAALAALGDEPGFGIDVDALVALADGSALAVTTQLGEEALVATDLGSALALRGVDRAALGPLPFFRESLLDELGDAPDFAEALRRLDGRALILPLETLQEQMASAEARASAWLRGND